MLYIHLLGHFYLFDGEAPRPFTALPKTLPLWAYLLLNRGKALTRQHLAFLLWPDEPEEKARTNLRRHLYELRRVLPPAPDGRPWLLILDDSMQWNPQADCWLDVAEFERLAASPEHLARAAAIYTGDLLPDLYEDWLAPERERLRSRHLACLYQLAIQNQAQRNFPQAIDYTQQILAREPLREDAICLLMRLRAQAGDRVGALQTYDRFVRILDDELGIPPQPETRALHTALLRELPLPPQSVSAPQAAATMPHNLPAQLNTFFGRDEELLALQNLFKARERRIRLLTLTGPGGSGKTRLALEAATHLLNDGAGSFPNGIFFVDLSAVRVQEGVFPAIARAMGLREGGGQALPERLKEVLRPRRLLLLLDNFEQIAAAGPLLIDLLNTAPDLHLLVTSRISLGVYGEHEYPVSPLPLPDLKRLPPAEQLAENASISLFVARACAHAPGFSLTDANALLVAAICVRLDGLPLALELAAGRIKLFPPQAILARLANRFDFLAGGERNLPPRHQTLRNAIHWSYELLDESERALFAALSVFTGGWRLEAAEAVCQPPAGGDVLTGLTALVNSSLIQQTSSGGEPRFTMLVTLHEYARDLLEESGQLADRLQRHAVYFTGLAEQALRDWRGPRQGFWMNTLAAENDNLQAALAWALEAPHEAQRIELAVRLAEGLAGFWRMSGQLDTGRDWHQRILAQRQDISPARLIRLLNQTGEFAQMQGQHPEAIALHEEALALARQLQDASLISYSLRSLGTAAARSMDYARAEPLLQESIAIEKSLSAGAITDTMALAFNNLAVVLRSIGENKRAAVLLKEVLAFQRSQGNQYGVAASLTNLGSVSLEAGNYAEAEAFFRESLALKHALGDQPGIASPFSGLAELAYRRGEMLRSLRLMAFYMAFSREINYEMGSTKNEKRQARLETYRQQLGEQAFNAGHAEGAAMTLERAIAYALGETPGRP
ncbi:MAG: tetratricopeptide repeat protein [Chloroflexota bacterium]